MLDDIYRKLIERRAVMALECFDSPPANWDGFQRRLGQYCELADLIDIVAKAMRGMEDDKE